MLTGSRFISDIASFELKPLFLVGSAITAVGFVFTVAAVHVVRYEPGFALVKSRSIHQSHACPNRNISYGATGTRPAGESGSEHTSTPDNTVMEQETPQCISAPSDTSTDTDTESEDEDPNTTRSLKLISLLSIFAAAVASTALILLSVMDTFRYKVAHHIFLRICFAGLAVQSACTAIVYANEVLGFVAYVHHLGKWQHDWGRRSLRVRVLCVLPVHILRYSQSPACERHEGARRDILMNKDSAALSTALIIVEVFLGVAFISLTVPEENPSYSKAGILEWVIAFLGTIYLWLFCGFLDRTSFEGYVPSALYGVVSRGADVERPLLGDTTR